MNRLAHLTPSRHTCSALMKATTALASVLAVAVPALVLPANPHGLLPHRHLEEAKLTSYSLETTISLGNVPSGPTSIAEDPVTNRTYVLSMGANDTTPSVVSVIDNSTNTVVATVDVSNYSGAIAVDPVTNMIYTSDYRSFWVQAINGATNTVVGSYTFNNNSPNYLTVDPDTDQVFVGMGGAVGTGGNVDVINAATGGVTDLTICSPTQCGGEYVNVFADPGTNTVYAFLTNSRQLYSLNESTDAFTAISPQSWSFSPLTLDPANNDLYGDYALSGGGAETAAFSLNNDTLVGPFPIGVDGNGSPEYLSSMAADASNSLVYGLNDSTGDLEALNGTSGQYYNTGIGSPGILAVDSATGTIYSDGGSEVLVIQGNPTPTFTPDGSAYYQDAWGGGSLSEYCQACSSTVAHSLSGYPVDTATGDLTTTSTDLSVPGAGVPLAFSRTYDAAAAQAEVTAGSPAPPLGYGWSDNLGMHLSYDSTTGLATVTEENGAETTFTPYVSGTSPAWCTGTTNFCATAPRMAATLNQNTDSTWSYVRTINGQTTFSFSAAGVLTAVSDPVGDTLSSAAYSPGTGQLACPTGDSRVAWTSSASGRELVEAFDASGQLVEVFNPDSGQTASYAYSGTGCSTWSTGPADLCSVTEPSGVVQSYTYDSANSTAAYDYDMTSETPPGASAQSTDLWSNGQVTEQTDPAGQTTTYAYAGDNASVSGGTTTVTTYPQGTGGPATEVTVYYYSSNVLVEQSTAYGTSAQANTYFYRDPSSMEPTSVVDGNGNSSSATYDTTGDVLTSTDGAGDTTAHAYNAFGQSYCTVDPADYANGTRCPTSAPSAPPVPGTDPWPGAQVSVYNGSDELVSTTDALGNTTLYAYTSGVAGVPNGIVYCSVDPADYAKGVTCPAYGASHVTGTSTTAFDAAGDATSTVDAVGDTTTTAAYTDSAQLGLPSSTTDAVGDTTSYTYNPGGQVTQQTTSFGSYSATTLYAYDAYGRRYCEVGPLAAAQGTTCPATPPSPSAPPAKTTSTFYDADGRVVQTTNALGGTTVTAYDLAGNAYCTVAPADYANGTRCPAVGGSWSAGMTFDTFDAAGRVVQVENPLGGVATKSYDGDSNVVQTTIESNNATDAPTVTTTYAYDAANRLVETTIDPGGTPTSSTTSSYDPNGHAFCTVGADAYASGTYSCPAWQASWITAPPSPSGATNAATSFANANGQVVLASDADGNTTASAYDPDGRVYCAVDATNYASGTRCPSAPPATPPTGTTTGYTTTIYDAAGRTTSVTDPSGDTTSTTYDPAGQVSTTIDPRGETTTGCYLYEDGSGQCASRAPAGAGAASMLYSVTTPATSADPSGMLTSYSYLPGGLTSTTTTPASTATSAYDAAGNLTSVSYSNVAAGYTTPANLSYSYNVDGTRHTTTDATGTTTYTYDDAGDVTATALVANAGYQDQSVDYGYYSTGALASVGYPSYGTYASPQASYAYDATGAMASVTDWMGNSVTFSHDAAGNVINQANPGGSAFAAAYDAAGLETSATSTLNQSCGGPETLTQGFSGTAGSRNASGQVTQFSDTYTGSCSSQADSSRYYSYDASGRVTYQGTTAQGSNPATFAYDASSDPTTISSHDASGNFDTYTQSFDAAGEVTAQSPVVGSQGQSSTYSYDTLGDQVTQTTGSATSTMSYNGAGQLAGYAPAAGTASSYAYNGDGLTAAVTGPTSVPTWGTPALVDAGTALAAASCPATSLCVAVDSAGNALTYNGTSWSAPTSVDSTRALSALSCPTTSFCAAVDSSGYVVTYNGSSWATPSQIDKRNSFVSVSCTSSSFCAAVDSSGNAFTYNGSAWSAATSLGRKVTPTAVSCASSSFCEAVDSAGNAYAYNGSAWSAATSIDSPRALSALSCPTTSFCVATDTSGYAVTYNGTAWSTPVDVDGTTALNAVACTSTTSCTAGDATGHALTLTGAGWSFATPADATRPVTGVSCAGSDFCEAVDGSGYAVGRYLPATATTQLTWDTNGSLALVLSDGTSDYLYGPGSTPVEQVNLSAQPSAANPTYLSYVPSAATWVAANGSGNLVSTWSYDAFGNLASGTPVSDFGFGGQYTDPASGLVDLRARDYQAQTGSFTTRDPAFASTDTAYVYAGGDPVNGGDPTGLHNVCGFFSSFCASVVHTTSSVLNTEGNAAVDVGEGAGDFGAGIANGVVSTVTFGHVHISMPFCGVPGWVYGAGSFVGEAGTFVAVAALTDGLGDTVLEGGSSLLTSLGSRLTLDEAGSVGGVAAEVGGGAEAAGAGASTDLAELEAGGGRGASFITNSNGETVPIPEGASGPIPADTGKGFQFTGGSGGNGLNSRVTGVRIMDPVTTGKYPSPNGYITYMNAEGQTVNPWTGQTISNADPWAHWEWSP